MTTKEIKDDRKIEKMEDLLGVDQHTITIKKKSWENHVTK